MPSNDHIRHVLLYEFHKGINTNLVTKSLQRVYGDDVVSERSCMRWFSHFGSEDLNLKHEPQEGHSTQLDSKEL